MLNCMFPLLGRNRPERVTRRCPLRGPDLPHGRGYFPDGPTADIRRLELRRKAPTVGLVHRPRSGNERREFITLLGGAAASWPLAARAQKSLPRIGWLVYGDAKLGPIDQSLKDAIAQAGLVDGRNIEIIFRYANGKPDQLAGLADDLIAQKPDLLLAVGGDVIKPLFEASKGRIPIVGGVSDSPMRAGFAASLARPSKNFTGITFLTDEMAAKRIELLKEVAPNARRLAVIFNPQHFDDEVTFARRGAESLGMQLTT